MIQEAAPQGGQGLTTESHLLGQTLSHGAQPTAPHPHLYSILPEAVPAPTERIPRR